MVDWLGKGKRFYLAEGGEEVNIQGRLLWLLPKVRNPALKGGDGEGFEEVGFKAGIIVPLGLRRAFLSFFFDLALEY